MGNALTASQYVYEGENNVNVYRNIGHHCSNVLIDYKDIIRSMPSYTDEYLRVSRQKFSISGNIDRICNHNGNMNFEDIGAHCVPDCRKGDIDCLSSGFGRCRVEVANSSHLDSKLCSTILLEDLFNREQLENTIISQRLIHEACMNISNTDADSNVVTQCIGNFDNFPDAYLVSTKTILDENMGKIACTTRDEYNHNDEWHPTRNAVIVDNLRSYNDGDGDPYSKFDIICGKPVDYNNIDYNTDAYQAPLCVEDSDRVKCEFNDYLSCMDTPFKEPSIYDRHCPDIYIHDLVNNVTDGEMYNHTYLSGDFIDYACSKWINAEGKPCKKADDITHTIFKVPITYDFGFCQDSS